mmetsp:Transcript_70589/g.166455  ORF Transcript_70589/g.166455 Transcript_70589/m.166455 type:complete len:148 (-) Transcript_70589:264-707(-)
MAGDHYAPSFLKVNPRHSVPCLEFDNMVITESHTILRFLAQQWQRDEWYPADLKRRIRVDEYLDWHPLHLRKSCAGILTNSVSLRLQHPSATAVRAELQDLTRLLTDSVATLEQWLSRPPGSAKFIASDSLSIADLVAVCELEVHPT